MENIMKRPVYSFRCHMKMADQTPKHVVGKLILMKARTAVQYLA